MSKYYKTLEKVFQKLNALDQAQAVLHWDSAVMMPPGGGEARTEQLATLDALKYAVLVDPAIENMLAKVGEERLNNWQQANVKRMQHQYNHMASVPKDLLLAFRKKSAKCELVWREAKQKNDFKLFAQHFKPVLSLLREIAAAKGNAFGCSPYDALLDQYDPGRKSVAIDVVFDDLKEFLPGFIEEALEKQKEIDKNIVPLKQEVPHEKQFELAKIMAEKFGFDFNQGRIDESLHPFCGGYPGDVRITTRYDENDFLSGMMAVLHETGHALYELGLPQKWQNQPVGQSQGMALHESQSLLFEMQIGRSAAFFEYATPIIRKVLGTKAKAWSAENLYRHATKVSRSLIRVDADEVTYSAHVLLRYYIERYLLDSEMEVDDLPDAWAQGMDKFLGVKPKTDSEGCLQDIHWADGTFGYFPSYTYGAIMAAQLFAAVKKDHKDVFDQVKEGKFSDVLGWLRKNVHELGSRKSADAVIKKATGSDLDVSVYKDYLKEKYLALR